MLAQDEYIVSPHSLLSLYLRQKAFAGSLFVMPSYKEPIVMAGSVLANINPNAPEIYIGDAISYISRYADFSNVKVIHLDRFKSINKLFSTDSWLTFPSGTTML